MGVLSECARMDARVPLRCGLHAVAHVLLFARILPMQAYSIACMNSTRMYSATVLVAAMR